MIEIFIIKTKSVASLMCHPLPSSTDYSIAFASTGPPDHRAQKSPEALRRPGELIA